jgi:hypothetical protein
MNKVRMLKDRIDNPNHPSHYRYQRATNRAMAVYMYLLCFIAIFERTSNLHQDSHPLVFILALIGATFIVYGIGLIIWAFLYYFFVENVRHNDWKWFVEIWYWLKGH